MNSLLMKIFIMVLLSVNTAFATSTVDPLPSWNDTAKKQAIITFVETVTKENAPNFVPPAERIVTFDNDGTLWPENPMYFPQAFTFDRIKALEPQHPEWKDQPLLQAVLRDDLETLLSAKPEERLALEGIVRAGYTTEEFAQLVKEWSVTAKHPKTGRLYKEMVYQPMIELLTYLRANGFKTFIVSGGWSDFIRPWAEEVYGIPPEQVVGSGFEMKFELRNDKPVLVFSTKINFIAEGPGKVIGINQYIGRRPIASCGNSDGDKEMLELASSGNGACLALLVHHTDAEREWAYDRTSHVGRLDKALDEARKKGWIVVDMKNDWKIIYAYEKKLK